MGLRRCFLFDLEAGKTEEARKTSFFFGRIAFMSFKLDYNWMQIVTADVTILFGRLKIFVPLVATYVAR